MGRTSSRILPDHFRVRVFIVAFALALLVAPVLAGGVTAGAPAAHARDAPDASARFVVGFHAWPGHVRVGDAWHDARVVDVFERLAFIVAEPADARAFLATVRGDATVRFVEEDARVAVVEGAPAPFFVPDDPRYADQYGPQQLRTPLAWDWVRGNLEAAVCVVDTGVRDSHEDLTGSRWLGGWDAINEGPWPWDENGHGTHVAGTAAATLGNGVGVAGMGNVGLYGVKVLNALGVGSSSDVAEGITWCADNTMERTVISLSLGSASASTVIRDAVVDAYAGKGKLLVAAAGNSGPCTDCVGYPAAFPDVVAVTCTTATGELCDFSSTGPEAELAAPGDGIISTYNSGDASYRSLSGTSMSTPHVSGLAALVWSQHRHLSNVDLRARLQETAFDLGQTGRDASFGFGRADAKCLLDGVTPCTLDYTADAPAHPGPVTTTTGPGAGEITLAWTAPVEDGGADVLGFTVYASESADGGFEPVGEVRHAHAFTHTGLPSGVARAYRVAAFNSFAQSAPASGIGSTFPPPSPPRDVHAEPVAPGVVRVTWTAPADDGGLPVTAYRVHVDGALAGDTGAGARVFDTPGLAEGAGFTFTLTAVTDAGESDPSAPASAVTWARPGAPGDVTAGPGDAPRALRVTWQEPGEDGGTAITGYRVWRHSEGEDGFTLVAETGGTARAFTDTDRFPAQAYAYRVTAVNAVGEGVPGGPACGRAFPWPEALDAVPCPFSIE